MPAGKFLLKLHTMREACRKLLRMLGTQGLLHRDALDGQRPDDLGEIVRRTELNERFIRLLIGPCRNNGGIAVMRGNLAPDGAVLQNLSSVSRAQESSGRAVVFETDSSTIRKRIPMIRLST